MISLQPHQKRAAIAIIRNPQGRFLLQLRDFGIDEYPGFWGFFGGGVEPEESEAAAIKRELMEELRLQPTNLIHLADFSHPKWLLHCFYIDLPNMDNLALLEGQDWGLFSTDQIRSGYLFSTHLATERPLCPPLAEAFEILIEKGFSPGFDSPQTLERT